MDDQGACEVSLLVTFYSVSSALFAQKVVAKAGVNCTVIPVPRSVSSSCGYALEILSADAGKLADELNKADIEWETVYRQETDKQGKYIPVLAFVED